MPSFSVDIDTLVHVYETYQDRLIGQKSRYTTEPHLGTNKTIDGWMWDGRSWPTDGEFKSLAYAPTLWDPLLSGIDEDSLQSGYGDNNDILLLDIEEVLTSGLNVWAPRIHHGYFYIRDEEWYLLSDSHITQYFTATGVQDSLQTLTLSHNYKPTIPILVRNWRFNRQKARHEIYQNFRKKIEFTDGGTEPEFIVDTGFSPPVLSLNGEYSEIIGAGITLTASGTEETGAVFLLEQVGISDGNVGQSFNTTFSPLDPDSDIEVWTWLDPRKPKQWEVVLPIEDFTISGQQVKVDRDRGILLFGDHNPSTATGKGLIPTIGSRIGIYYTTAVAAQYEPINTPDDILAYSAFADVNPVSSSAGRGFVQVTTESVDPASIILTSTLPQINPFIIELGNNIGEMIAEVKSAGGVLLEGQEVTFQILDPEVGTFGATSTEAIAITGANGQARTFYNSPLTIQDLGRATVTVVHDGNDTVIDVAGIVEPLTTSGIYIYKIHEYDEVLGIPEGDEATYYSNYLTGENITSGVQATGDFEQQYRTNNSMALVETYTSSEISKGKKTIVLTTRDSVMNSHTGFIEPGTLVPLLPNTVTNIGTDAEPILRLTYKDVNLDLPGTNDTKAYFIVGDTQTRLQAFVTNRRTNRRIFSNIIQLEVRIPDAVNGTFFASLLNDIPSGLLTSHVNVNDIPDAIILSTSGIDSYLESYFDERNYVHVSGIYENYVEWFRRTRKGDTVALNFAATELGQPLLTGLSIVQPINVPAEIPLGWRLKSSGVTVASVLDQVTYVDPNDILPSGFFSV